MSNIEVIEYKGYTSYEHEQGLIDLLDDEEFDRYIDYRCDLDDKLRHNFERVVCANLDLIIWKPTRRLDGKGFYLLTRTPRDADLQLTTFFEGKPTGHIDFNLDEPGELRVLDIFCQDAEDIRLLCVHGLDIEAEYELSKHYGVELCPPYDWDTRNYTNESPYDVRPKAVDLQNTATQRHKRMKL